VGGRLESPAFATEVSGWVVFAGARVDRVDIFLDGECVARAFHGIPRPDLLGPDAPGYIETLTAGFRDVVALPQSCEDQRRTISVVATSVDGRTWRSSEVMFDVPAVTSADEDLLLTLPPANPKRQPRHGGGQPRICVFTHSLNLGGGELYLQELLMGLRRTCEILVVAPFSAPLHRELEDAGISVHITAGYSVEDQYYGGRISELAAIVRAFDADVALVNTLGIFIAADAALHAGVPVIWAIHESFPLPVIAYYSWGPRGLAFPLFERWLEAFRCAQLVYEAEATLALHANEVPGLSARVIRYGIDLEQVATYQQGHDRAAVRETLGFVESDRVLLCMGLIQERKAQLPLLLAFADVAARFPRAKLAFVGYSGSVYSDTLRTCVDALNLQHRVVVAEIDPDTYRWYLAADVLVSASAVESLPRSMMEAHAFGVPVLAADSFGVREIVSDGETGWLFPTNSSAAMTLAIARTLAVSDSDLARYSRRARAASTAYGRAGYIGEYSELIHALAAGNAPTGSPELVTVSGTGTP
jgi:D-inositol-3-phosphate glycosyltransferase